MSAGPIYPLYISIALVVLLAVAPILLYMRATRGHPKLTPNAGLAFGLLVAGIVFGENRWLGYGLIGAGVVLAVVDTVNKLRQKIE